MSIKELSIQTYVLKQEIKKLQDELKEKQEILKQKLKVGKDYQHVYSVQKGDKLETVTLNTRLKEVSRIALDGARLKKENLKLWKEYSKEQSFVQFEQKVA